jgi:hypothetical protein
METATDFGPAQGADRNARMRPNPGVERLPRSAASMPPLSRHVDVAHLVAQSTLRCMKGVLT